MNFREQMKWLFRGNPDMAKKVHLTEALNDLLLPGLRGIERKFALVHGLRDDWGAITRRADQHLKEWLPQHLDDYKTAFYPHFMEWFAEQVGPLPASAEAAA